MSSTERRIRKIRNDLSRQLTNFSSSVFRCFDRGERTKNSRTWRIKTLKFIDTFLVFRLLHNFLDEVIVQPNSFGNIQKCSNPFVSLYPLKCLIQFLEFSGGIVNSLNSQSDQCGQLANLEFRTQFPIGFTQLAGDFQLS